MLGIRYEEYIHIKGDTPCVIYSDIKKNNKNLSTQMNWHEDLELEICESGSGEVLLDGEKIDFNNGDIVTVNSNVLHYTSTQSELNYSALIISAEFCHSVGIDCETLKFKPIINDKRLLNLISELKNIYLYKEGELKRAKIHQKLLEILILLTESYSKPLVNFEGKKESFNRVKSVINIIRADYDKKLLLEDIASRLYMDKFVLSREFKRVTGQTVVEYINSYRCGRAAILIKDGYTVSQAAFMCGFNNLSFFSKTFRQYMGVLPSKIRE